MIGRTEEGRADAPATRRSAWLSASVGYLAGALDLGLEMTSPTPRRESPSAGRWPRSTASSSD